MAPEEPKLGRDVYIALAAVGWADGNLDPEEADAIVRTALEEGLDIAEIAEIEAATKERVDLGIIDRKNLSKEDRLFVYGVACWLTRLDGVVSAAETEALDRLGETLKIPAKPRGIVDGIAREVANRGDDRPSRYDLHGLRRAIGDRLKSAQAKKDGE